MKKNPVATIRQALDVLGLPPLVTWSDIKKRYRELSRRYHPDLQGSSEEMAKINWAYEVLKKYVQNYKFSFSDEEILKQFPEQEYLNKFRF